MNDRRKCTEKLCQGCEKEPATEAHACPFAQEIGGSTDEAYCNCCKECRYQCAMDI